jgi:transposase
MPAEGYTGSYSVVRDYIHPKRPLRESKATVRYETEPGHQMQNDWGAVTVQVGGSPQKVHFTVNTLGYSRRFHFWCTQKEDAEHTYEGIIQAFEYFGGVPKEVLVDNQKSLVVHHHIRDAVHFNERFLDLAGHYGFTPRACRPYRARTKGKDERMVGYVKGNFFVRYRRFDGFEHMNLLAQQWLREEADQRKRRTSGSTERSRRWWPSVSSGRLQRWGPCLWRDTTPPTGSRGWSTGTATSTSRGTATAFPPFSAASR